MQLEQPPSRSAAHAIVSAITGRGAVPQESFVAPTLICPASLAGQPIPQRRWIVDGWLPVGTTTLSYGDGGTGKTLLAQQLMTACATGTPWCGLAVKRCRTLGIFCEDDADELHRRQADICAATGVRLDELHDMQWISRVGADNLLMTFERDGIGTLTPLFQFIAKAAHQFGAGLVILDTAADLFGGNENDRNQVRQFINAAGTRLAQTIGGAVLINAHPSKSGMAAGGSMDSGSTGWSNSSRSRWSLERPTDDEGRVDIHSNERILTRRKANYASIGDIIKLRWEVGALLPLGAPASFTRASTAQQAKDVFLKLLSRCDVSNKPLSDSKASTNYAPKVFALRPDRESFSRKEFEVAMNNLMVEKVITLQSYGRKHDERRRIVRVIPETLAEAGDADAVAEAVCGAD